MERLSKIIQTLSGAQGFVSIDDLAKDLGVTPRTIRNDLPLLEQMLEGSGIQIVKKRNLGIRLDKQHLPEKSVLNLMAQASGEKDFYSAAERENLIMEALLLEQEPLTLNRMKELTFSSKSSVVKNLSTCEAKLGKWQITVSKRPRNGMKLEYTEYQWRMAVLEHIMQYVWEMDFHHLYENLINGNRLDISLLFNKFLGHFVYNVNTIYIANFIRRYETDNKLRFTDKAFISIFFYICIGTIRIRSGHEFKKSNFELNRFFHKERINEYVLENLEFLNKGLKEAWNRFELEALLVFMLAQKQFSEHGFLENVFIEDEYFNQKTCDITKRFIQTAENCLEAELSSDENLFHNLLLHLRPTIFRLLFGIRIENPLAEDIKKTYPAIFAACQEAARVIAQETKIPVNDDEIGYLAMHVGASFEKVREKQFAGICRILIICPEGNGTSSILHYRLLNSIPNIQIEGICSIGELNQINKANIDLMISTVPIYTEDQFHIISVNPLLYEEDKAKIRRAIKRMSLTKKNGGNLIIEDVVSILSNYASIQDYNGLYNDLDHYFNQTQIQNPENQKTLRAFLSPSLILPGAEAKTWQEAFQLAGSLLYKAGYVEKRYIDCMIDNAQKYGGYMIICDYVALPHAKASDGVNRTGFSFVTLKEPVIFQHEQETHPIQFVAALSADNSMRHLTAMGELIELVCQEDKRKRLMEIRDAEEFIRFVREYCEKNDD